MCEQRDIAETKIDRLIAAIDRLCDRIIPSSEVEAGKLPVDEVAIKTDGGPRPYAWHAATSAKEGFDVEMHALLRKRFDDGRLGIAEFVLAGMPIWQAEAADREMARQLAEASNRQRVGIRQEWQRYCLAFLEVGWRGVAEA